MLQRAHRLAIAFENLDIPLGRGIDLDPEHVFDKLVTRRRGGYCFEQNQLFLRALQALGFDARPLLARVWLGLSPGETPPRTHTLNLVALDGQQWIADAGFGGSYTPPMPLIDGHEVPTPDGAHHRLRVDPDHGWLLERKPSGEADWQAQYSFTTDPVFGMDLVMANHYTATAYQTRFTTFVVASIATDDGFASLVDRKLSTYGEPRQIESADELRGTLGDVFGIQLTDGEVKRLKLFES
jgi:N-hydroxyarylamine O-acetyltransferase